jgi:ATP-dependent helicase/nuclease subunit A
MRDRIRRICRKRLEGASDDQAEYWLDLVRQIDAARISTVHSFCTSLLRSHAVQSGLDPNFQILDAPLAEALRMECLDDVLRERLIVQDPAVLALIRRFGLNSARDKIAAMLKCRDKRPMAEFASLKPEELVAQWDQVRPEVHRSILQELSRHPSFIETLSLARIADIPNRELNQKRQFLVEHLPQLPVVDDPATLIDKLRDATMLGRGRGENHWGADDTLAERYKKALKALRGKLDGAKELLDWDANIAREAAEASLAVLTLAVTVEERYRDAKRQQQSLDFDDVLVESYGLLAGNADVRRDICRHMKLLLVDESQDTNRLQVDLITALCGDDGIAGGKLFFVGDFRTSASGFPNPGVCHSPRTSAASRRSSISSTPCSARSFPTTSRSSRRGPKPRQRPRSSFCGPSIRRSSGMATRN